MPIKKVELKKEETKKPEKKEFKKLPKKEAIKEVIEEKKSIAPIVEPLNLIVVPANYVNAHSGIGIVGTNEAVKQFQGKVKMKGLKVGKVLMEFIIDWNSKN